MCPSQKLTTTVDGSASGIERKVDDGEVSGSTEKERYLQPAGRSFDARE